MASASGIGLLSFPWIKVFITINSKQQGIILTNLFMFAVTGKHNSLKPDHCVKGT